MEPTKDKHSESSEKQWEHYHLYDAISKIPNGMEFLKTVNEGIAELKSLRSELAKQKELKDELVKVLKMVNGLVDAHDLGQYIPQGNIDSAIKKASEI